MEREPEGFLPEFNEPTPGSEQLERANQAHDGFVRSTLSWLNREKGRIAGFALDLGELALWAGADYSTGGLLTTIGAAVRAGKWLAARREKRKRKERASQPALQTEGATGEEETFEIAFQEGAPQSAAQEFIEDTRKKFNNFRFTEVVEPADQTKEPPYVFEFEEPKTPEEAKAQYALLKHMALEQKSPIFISGPTPFYNAESEIRGRINLLELREKLQGEKYRRELEEIRRERPEIQDRRLRELIRKATPRRSQRFQDQEITPREHRELLEDLVAETTQPKKIKREPLPSERKEATREGAAEYLEQLGRDVLRALAGKMSDEEIANARQGTVGYYLKPHLYDPNQRDRVLFFIAHMVRHEIVEYMRAHPDAVGSARLASVLRDFSRDPTLDGESIISMIGPMSTLWAEDVLRAYVPETAKKVQELRNEVKGKKDNIKRGVLNRDRLTLPDSQERLQAAEAGLDDTIVRSIRDRYRELKRQVLASNLRTETKDGKTQVVPTGRQQVPIAIPVDSSRLPDLAEAARISDPGKKTVKKLRSKKEKAKLSDAEKKKIQAELQGLEERKEQLETRINELAEQRRSEQVRARSRISRQERQIALNNATRISGEIMKLQNTLSGIERRMRVLRRGRTVLRRYIETTEVDVEPVEVGVVRVQHNPIPELPKPPE